MEWSLDDILKLKITSKRNGIESFYFWSDKVQEVLKAKSKSIEV